MNQSTIEANLELRLDGESFTGTVTTGDESAPFTGWLGLMSVVESLLMDAAGAERLANRTTEGNE
jgi:hypothetical protein